MVNLIILEHFAGIITTKSVNVHVYENIYYVIKLLPHLWEPAKKALVSTNGRCWLLDLAKIPSAVACCCNHNTEILKI